MSKNSDLSDLTNLEWLSKKGSTNYLQNLIFSTFHRVLDGLTISEEFSKGLILIQFIQLCTLIVNDKNTELVQVLPAEFLSLIKFPLVYSYLKEVDFVYTVIVLAPAGLFLALVMYLFFQISRLTEKEHKEYGGMKNFFGVSMYLLDTVLGIPLFGLGFKLSMCGQGTGYLACNSTGFFVSVLLAIVMLLSLFFIEMVVGMFFFNFDFKLKDNLSRSYNIMHLVFRLYCTIMVGLDVYMTDSSQKWTTVYFIHFIFASIFCIDYYNRLPYYNPNVSEYYCNGVFGYFWISLVVLATFLASYPLITNNMIWLILIGLVFFLYVVRTYREFFYRKLLIKEIDEIDNEIHLDARFRYLMQIVTNSKKNKQDELLLTSIIKVHTEKCAEPTCVCKNRAELFDPKSREEFNPNIPMFKNQVFIKNYLLMLIKDSCKKLPKSSLLNIDLFLFYFKEMANLSQVNHNIILFEKQSQQSLFVTVRYAIYRLRISLYYNLKDRNKNRAMSSIMFENVRTFDEEMKFLNKTCLKIVEQYARMWDILNDAVPDLVLLERVCTKLIDDRDLVEKIYHKILSVTKSSVNFMVLMAMYSKFIAFDDLLFNEIQERIKKLIPPRGIENSIDKNELEFKRQFMYQEGGKHLINMDGPACSIAISFSFENLGQIVWSSENCMQIFEYESNYLRTFNVGHIIPGVIAKNHNKFLMRYFTTGRETLLNNMSHLWALNKSKVLFSVFLVLKLYIAKEGLAVLSLIRKLNDHDYVLLSKKGKVDSCGTRLRSMLRVLSSDFFEKNNFLNIMTFAPKLIGIFLPYIYDYPELNFIGLKNHEELVEKYMSEFYVFVHRDMDKRQQSFGETISQKGIGFVAGDTPVISYIRKVHEYLNLEKNFKNENFEIVYRVKAKIRKRVFQDGAYTWEMKIFDVQQIHGQSVHADIWARETSFIERIAFGTNKDDKSSLQDRIKDLKNKEKVEKDTKDEKEKEILNNLKDQSEGKGNAFAKMFKRNKTLKGAAAPTNVNTQLPVVADVSESRELGEGTVGAVARKDSEEGKGTDRNDSQERKAGGFGGFGALRAAGKKASKIHGIGIGAFGLKNNLAEKNEEKLPLVAADSIAGADKGAGAALEKKVEKSVDKPPAAGFGGLGGKGKGLFGKLGGGAAKPAPTIEGSETKEPAGAAAASGGGGGIMGGNRLRGLLVARGNQKDAGQSQAESNIKTITMLPQSMDLPDPVSLDADVASGEIDNSSKTTAFKGGSDFERGKEGAIRLIMKNFNAEDQEAYDGSSVASKFTNTFVQRDTLKKIKMSIQSKNAPLNLRISIALITVCFLLSIFVNILTKTLSDSVYSKTENFLWLSSNLTQTLLKYNKLNAYLQYSSIQARFIPTGGYQLIYPQNITSRLSYDANKTLDTLMSTQDLGGATLAGYSNLNELMRFFYYTERVYSIDKRSYGVATLTFFNTVLKGLYSYIKFGLGNIPDLSYKALYDKELDFAFDNQNAMLDFSLQYSDKSQQMAKDLNSEQFGVLVADIATRLALLAVCLAIAIPLLFKSMQKSNEILQLIARISNANTTFYNNHYNKLISQLNNENTNFDNALEVVSKNYTVGLKEKERAERQNANKKRKIGLKDYMTSAAYKRKMCFWFVCSVGVYLVLAGLQCARPIFSFSAAPFISQSVLSSVQIPNTLNAYAAINLLTFSLLSYPLFNVPKDAVYQKAYSLMTQFFDETVARKETVGESRLEIKDSTFETVYNNLFTQDLCVTVFSSFVFDPASTNPLENCDAIIQKYAKHNLKAFFSYYQTSSWSKITYLNTALNTTQVKTLLVQGMVMETYYLFPWFEQAVLLWDRELILQTQRIIASNHKTTLYLCVAEVIVYLVLALLTLFYLYPRLKRGVLYSLSFLLLIPFHIFKENEMFSTFLKKKVKFSGMI